jgi:hypothetical protein
MSGQSKVYLMGLAGSGEPLPESSESCLTGGVDCLLLALEREHGDPRTDIAVQMIQALDAVRCRDKYQD